MDILEDKYYYDLAKLFLENYKRISSEYVSNDEAISAYQQYNGLLLELLARGFKYHDCD